jgi:hypothetical protein
VISLVAAVVVVALAPQPGDDARKAVVLGKHGEVYAPDASGDYVRTKAFATADVPALAGRAGGAVVALGDGVVYRLADNGWTAIRLVQKGKALMSGGKRSVAVVGRQLFALDRTAGGEPAKLALAPRPVLAIASGDRGVVILTDRGLLRLQGTAFKRVPRAPRRIAHLVSDRWALADRGAVDLTTGATTAWPAGLSNQSPAAGPDAAPLAAIGATRTGLELVTLAGRKLVRDPIADTRGAKAVGVAVDKAGRAVVALADGRVARRERGTWTLSSVRDELPPARPGSGPATAP